MFEYEVKYQKGLTNIETDMSFRNPISNYLQSTLMLLNLEGMKTEHKRENDKKYKKLDVLMYKRKGFHKLTVIVSLRKKIPFTVHEQFCQPGVQKMLNLIISVYYWPHLTEDILNFVMQCKLCQLKKKT